MAVEGIDLFVSCKSNFVCNQKQNCCFPSEVSEVVRVFAEQNSHTYCDTQIEEEVNGAHYIINPIMSQTQNKTECKTAIDIAQQRRPPTIYIISLIVKWL